MPALEEQLREIELGELKHEIAYPKLNKLNAALFNAEVIAGFIAFFLTAGTVYFVFYVLFAKYSFGSNLFILWIYVCIFLIGGLQSVLENPVKKFFHYFYKINRDTFEKEIVIRKGFTDKKKQVQREIHKAEEQAFVFRLNDFVYKLDNKIVPFEEARIIQKQLEDENITIRMRRDYQLYSLTYYNNRLKKIEETLTNYQFPNKTYNPVTTLNKHTTKSTTANEKLVTDSNQNKVDPFSDNYNPIERTEIPIPAADKIVAKTEPPVVTEMPVTKIESHEIEKPIIKADLSVIKDNAINTTETPIEHLFTTNVESEANVPREKQNRQPVKVDFVKLNEKKYDIGTLGELFALEWEKERLERNRMKVGSNDVVHVSLTDDSIGYDIKSLSEDGSSRFIEVKTTTDSHKAPFYLSETEMAAMDNLKNYFIYRVYWFNIETGNGEIYVIDCDNEIDKYYKVQPASYRVSPK